MCGESDASSDFTKGSSTESGACECPPATVEAQALFYQNKALATMQILRNQEETLRVQAESLREAEERISVLTLRNTQLRQQLDTKAQETILLRKSLEKKSAADSIDDVETTQKDYVRTLQDNLSMIQELYAECFYETAKQEEIIDMLRKSYLDVRLVDDKKTKEIGRLQNVINKQKWSLNKCQEITREVENLKLDIWNFLNSSNNDSGMWERSDDSLSNEVGEDLQEIMQQLYQLRDVLLDECWCQEDAVTLKQTNHSLAMKMVELNQKIGALEQKLLEKDNTIQKYAEEVKLKTKQLEEANERLLSVEQGSRLSEQTLTEKTSAANIVKLELENVQGLLKEKTSVCLAMQSACQIQEKTIRELNEKLNKSNDLAQENYKLRSEVSQLTNQLHVQKTRLADSEMRVRRLEVQVAEAQNNYHELDERYREKAVATVYLQKELCAATQRGADLCAESRRVLAGLRAWIARMRHTHSDQKKKIQEKNDQISCLLQKIKLSQDCHEDSIVCGTIASCSMCSNEGLNVSERAGLNDTTEQCCARLRERQSEVCPSRARETSECCSKSLPTTHRRDGRTRSKSSLPENKRQKRRGARDQEHARQGRSGENSPLFYHSEDVQYVQVSRDLSPTAKLMQQVEMLQDALKSGHQRWLRSQWGPSVDH